jgi:hypothetical protein
MITCPDCGTQNDDTARFCDNCGRRLDDVTAEAAAAPQARAENDMPMSSREFHARETTAEREGAPAPAGTLLADDGLPVGRDLDGIPGGERVIWEGRPSRLWSPRMALMNRYRLTNQRLIMEYGFVGKTTEEIELYRVMDVGVSQHPLERMVQIGDIYVASGDASTPTKYLHNIPDPNRVKDLLREATRQERDRRRVMLREDF